MLLMNNKHNFYILFTEKCLLKVNLSPHWEICIYWKLIIEYFVKTRYDGIWELTNYTKVNNKIKRLHHFPYNKKDMYKLNSKHLTICNVLLMELAFKRLMKYLNLIFYMGYFQEF